MPTSSSFAEAADFLTTVHYRSKEGNEVKRVILSQPPAAQTSRGAGHTREQTLSDSFVVGTQSISPIKTGLLEPGALIKAKTGSQDAKGKAVFSHGSPVPVKSSGAEDRDSAPILELKQQLRDRNATSLTSRNVQGPPEANAHSSTQKRQDSCQKAQRQGNMSKANKGSVQAKYPSRGIINIEVRSPRGAMLKTQVLNTIVTPSFKESIERLTDGKLMKSDKATVKNVGVKAGKAQTQKPKTQTGGKTYRASAVNVMQSFGPTSVPAKGEEKRTFLSQLSKEKLSVPKTNARQSARPKADVMSPQTSNRRAIDEDNILVHHQKLIDINSLPKATPTTLIPLDTHTLTKTQSTGLVAGSKHQKVSSMKDKINLISSKSGMLPTVLVKSHQTGSQAALQIPASINSQPLSSRQNKSSSIQNRATPTTLLKDPTTLKQPLAPSKPLATAHSTTNILKKDNTHRLSTVKLTTQTSQKTIATARPSKGSTAKKLLKKSTPIMTANAKSFAPPSFAKEAKRIAPQIGLKRAEDCSGRNKSSLATAVMDFSDGQATSRQQRINSPDCAKNSHPLKMMEPQHATTQKKSLKLLKRPASGTSSYQQMAKLKRPDSIKSLTSVHSSAKAPSLHSTLGTRIELLNVQGMVELTSEGSLRDDACEQQLTRVAWLSQKSDTHNSGKTSPLSTNQNLTQAESELLKLYDLLQARKVESLNEKLFPRLSQLIQARNRAHAAKQSAREYMQASSGKKLQISSKRLNLNTPETAHRASTLPSKKMKQPRTSTHKTEENLSSESDTAEQFEEHAHGQRSAVLHSTVYLNTSPKLKQILSSDSLFYGQRYLRQVPSTTSLKNSQQVTNVRDEIRATKRRKELSAKTLTLVNQLDDVKRRVKERLTAYGRSQQLLLDKLRQTSAQARLTDGVVGPGSMTNCCPGRLN